MPPVNVRFEASVNYGRIGHYWPLATFKFRFCVKNLLQEAPIIQETPSGEAQS